MPYSRPFDDPMPHGIATLKHAADYILKLPKSEQAKPHWQAAVEAVIMAAEDRGPLLHARVGMLQALNFGEPNPQRERKRAKQFKIIKRD